MHSPGFGQRLERQILAPCVDKKVGNVAHGQFALFGELRAATAGNDTTASR